MRKSPSKSVIRNAIEISDRFQQAVEQGRNASVSNTEVVEYLLKMGADINAKETQQHVKPAVHAAVDPIEGLLDIAARLLLKAMAEQMSPTLDQPLDPFWVNDTGFRRGFAKVSEKLNEPMSHAKAAIILRNLESLSRE